MLYSWPDEDEFVEPQEYHLVLYEADNQMHGGLQQVSLRLKMVTKS